MVPPTQEKLDPLKNIGLARPGTCAEDGESIRTLRAVKTLKSLTMFAS
jgi:hypothetical protein